MRAAANTPAAPMEEEQQHVGKSTSLVAKLELRHQ